MENKLFKRGFFLIMSAVLTTSIISGTYAKYTSGGSVSDGARVAKWGVTVTTTGKLFDKTYLSGTNGNPGNGASDGSDNTGLSVESSENVIAPGTKNSEGLTIQISGQPEVDVQVTFRASTTKGDVFLNGMGLPDLTTSDNTSDTFTADRYYPVKYTLSHNGTAAESDKNLTLSQLISRLNSLTMRYDAGTNLASSNAFGKYTITWEWTADNNDKADTLLGSLTSGTTEIQGMSLKEGSQYNLSSDLTIEVIVSQVD